MLLSSVESGRRILSFGDRQVFVHSSDLPFITAIRREKTYEANRGTVKERVTEVERVPLADVSETGGGLTFSAKGHSVSVAVSELPDGVQLALSGEDGWAYEFRLPAIENEAVFGGGEQYRKTNLRGEAVVNFVSEHIKAVTIIEKALLPRFLYREKPHSAIGSYAPMPVFVTDRGRMIRFDTASDGKSTFGKDTYTFVFDACPKSLSVTFGDSFDALLTAYAALTFRPTDLFFLASAACVTANAFIIKTAQDKHSQKADTISYYNNFVVLLLFALFAVSRGDLAALKPSETPGFWWLAALGGLAQTGIYFFYYRNLKRHEVWVVKLWLLLMPVLSCIVGVLFLNEEPTVWKLVGIGVVLIGAGIILLRGKLHPEEKPKKEDA